MLAVNQNLEANSVFVAVFLQRCSLRCRRNLTPVSNVGEAAPNSVLWTANGLNELPGVRFEFPFTPIDNCQSTGQS